MAAGCGLAAPQLGVTKRLVVVDCDQAESGEQDPIVLVNPVLVDAQGDPVVEGEGCLSCPGISVPIEAGIMPVLSASSIQRMVSLCGASLPRKLTRILGKYGDHPDALREAGIAYATDQIIDLYANGIKTIHVYTMNTPDVAAKILDNLSDILG